VERIEEIELHQEDQVLYDFFKEKAAKIAAGLTKQDGGASRIGEGKSANILTLINFLRRICNSGEDLLPQSAVEAWRSRNDTSVDWQMMQNCKRICDSCNLIREEDDLRSDDNPAFDCHHSICTNCSMQSENTIDEVRKCPKCVATQVRPRNAFCILKSSSRFSTKVEALIQNLDAEQTMGEHEDKAQRVKRYPNKRIRLLSHSSKDFEELIYHSVVFSQWTKMLDLIAMALKQHGFRFQRIDGQSSLQQRSVAIQQFNDDPTCTVMVASIGSAGEG